LIWSYALTLGQKCYKCTEEQVNTLPVNDERYENIDTAFAVPDFSGGSAPDYWSSASSSHESSSYVSKPFTGDEMGRSWGVGNICWMMC
jgi:hypothetical protein